MLTPRDAVDKVDVFVLRPSLQDPTEETSKHNRKRLCLDGPDKVKHRICEW